MNIKESRLLGLKGIVNFSKRYLITLVFPIVCFGAIFKDYNQTLIDKARRAKSQEDTLDKQAVPYKVQAAYGIFAVVVFGSLGEYVQKQEVNRMTRFRDKTALYGSEKGPDDEPSWGCKEKDFKWNFSQWPRTWWY